MPQASSAERTALVGRGRNLEYMTIGWNAIEGIVAIAAGVVAGSISLTAFGIDSLIEVTSGVALLWRMVVDSDAERGERNEKRALRVVGICFLALAAYIFFESGADLLSRKTPERSLPGVVLACASLVAMPLLAHAKRRAACELGSAAMRADAKQTEFCFWLSGILLAGLVLNATFGLWWADAVAALVMAPLIAKEGIEALRGDEGCDSCSD
jgi:divalent metal cation (Fe/Co/Zn/Cd) transporter